MASLVKQSSTQLALKFFLTLSSDHISPATGKTPTVTIRKEGGSFASPAGAVTEIANGWYQVAGNATDTNTLGEILLHATEASSDNCDMVVAEVVAFDPQSSTLGVTYPTNFSTLSIDGSGKVTPTTVFPTNFSLLAIDGSGNVTAAAASNIKKNTAQNGFMFVMTTGNPPVPTSGLTVSAQVAIDGANFVSTVNSPVEMVNGAYKINLAAADTNGNHLLFLFSAGGANNLFLELITTP